MDRAALQARQPSRVVLLDAAYAGDTVVAVGERGLIVRSADEGRSWQQAVVPASATLTAVSFQDEKHGLAVGHGGLVLATEDAGRSWQKRMDGRQIAQLMLASAERSGQERALAQARQLVADGPDKPLFALLQLDGRRMLAVGAYNIVLRSEDGGRSWTVPDAPLDNPQASHIYAARARGTRVLLAGEQGLILLSEDGGKNFRRLPAPYRGSFFTAEITADGGILVAGLRGNVWHSPDGGAHWHVRRTSSQATVTHSSLLGDEPLLSTLSGQLLRRQDDALIPLLGTPLPSINAILPLRSGGVLALTGSGAIALPATAFQNFGTTR
ncbi:WD40/YVTN/BNR-like repeat-containing protein [Noviherbaspirillum saxi]|uniref:WD40/YVTN/BNR-like repeat-containing protein n=1 Tax=Noviherbaspirillum saxi TaxID=2320863 RepID=UPI0013148B60|nr:YCF48-related protein [Noviherbaspirillum saxi]